MSKPHAEHNEKVCKDLHNSGKDYQDWVVTTAFYSALHFVRHKIFPFNENIGGTNYKITGIDQYYQLKQNAGWKGSKHKALKNLVSTKAGKVKVDYSRLYDYSQNARYLNYKVSSGLAQDALKRLDAIKKFCC